MNTTLNTQSRRRTIPGYKSIAKKMEEKRAKELADIEEQKKLAEEEKIAGLQREINSICNSVQSSYTAMVNAGKDLASYQRQLDDKEREAELFQETREEVYPLDAVNEADYQKMKIRRVAYYVLPFLDCFFAFMCLYPIVTSKIYDLSMIDPALLIAIGAGLAVIVGLGISTLARMGAASLEEGEEGRMKRLKLVAMGGAVLALPLMYIISEIAFNGGEDWTYSGSFAFISLVIQLLIITGYKRQQEALQYFRDKKVTDQTRLIEDKDEMDISNEKRNLEEGIRGSIDRFNLEYASFTDKFRALAAARDEYVEKTGRTPKYYLNQIVIYFGDVVCFRYEAIPLYRSDGAVLTISTLNFPNVTGCSNILENDDFVILDYMMQRTNTGISLAQTLSNIGSHRNGQLPEVSVEDGTSALSPGLVPEQPVGPEDDAPDDEPDDGEGIW